MGVFVKAGEETHKGLFTSVPADATVLVAALVVVLPAPSLNGYQPSSPLSMPVKVCVRLLSTSAGVSTRFQICALSNRPSNARKPLLAPHNTVVPRLKSRDAFVQDPAAMPLT